MLIVRVTFVSLTSFGALRKKNTKFLIWFNQQKVTSIVIPAIQKREQLNPFEVRILTSRYT